MHIMVKVAIYVSYYGIMYLLETWTTVRYLEYSEQVLAAADEMTEDSVIRRCILVHTD